MRTTATFDREDGAILGSCLAIIFFCCAASYYNDYIREKREAEMNRLFIEAQLEAMGYEDP